jgi:hypothetical protein
MSEPPAVVFLTAALDRAEQLARAAGGREIEAVEYLWETKYLNVRQPDGTVTHTTEFSAELADHIALHDPAAVLRRVAADRKILAEHADMWGGCAVCVDRRNPDPRQWGIVVWPCRTVLLLAEAWGWEGEPALEETDLRVDVFSNSAECAVRVMHVPSGLVASAQGSRGQQWKLREQARRELAKRVAGRKPVVSSSLGCYSASFGWVREAIARQGLGLPVQVGARASPSRALGFFAQFTGSAPFRNTTMPVLKKVLPLPMLGVPLGNAGIVIEAWVCGR